MATAEQIAAVYRAADAYGIPRDLFFRQIKQESGFRPEVWDGRVRSSAGAIGAGQLMPGTAAELGVDPYDVEQNLMGAARYLRQQLDTFGDPALALAAYNAGPGRVRQAGGVPNIEETQNYVRTILGDTAPAPQNALSGGFTPSQGMDPQMMQMNALAALNRARPQYQGNALDASALQQNARNFMV
jgi:hypothetical protein